MGEHGPERRQHGRFRILYLDFESIWNRFIRRKRKPPRSPSGPKAHSIHPKAQADDLGNHPVATGVKEIDAQHLEIRDAFLALQRNLRDGAMDQALTESLDLLSQRMNAHFEYEEAYLEHVQFPGLQNHRAEHAQFRAQILQLRERAGAGDHTLSLEISSFLFNWFRQHTLIEDSTFAKSTHRP
jgi:hemerythrin